MLQVGQIIELTHGATHQKSPHIVQTVTEGSARAVPISYKDTSVEQLPSTVIASISPNSFVKVYNETEAKELLASLVVVDDSGNEVKRRGRKPGTKNKKKDVSMLVSEYKGKRRSKK